MNSFVRNNFYVRLPQHLTDLLDNSSEGSFTNRTEKEANDLLDTISKNTDAWDLHKGNEPYIEYEY
jgi:hypothetical protein